MLAVIFHQFNYFLNSYDCMYKKDKLPIHAAFFLSSPNKKTLELIKYLVIKIISSTLSLLWQEKSVENNAKQFQLSWRKVVYATIWGQFLRHCGKRDLESRLRKT